MLDGPCKQELCELWTGDGNVCICAFMEWAEESREIAKEAFEAQAETWKEE